MPGSEDKDAAFKQRELFAQQLKVCVENSDVHTMNALLSDVSPVDLAEILQDEDFDPRQQAWILHCLDNISSEKAGELLDALPTDHVVELAEAAPQVVAEAVEGMEPDERTDVLEALPEETVEAVLESFSAREAREARELLAYDHDSAGGIMTPAFLILPESTTAAEAISFTRRRELSETVNHLFVADEQNHLVGDIPLHKLVFAAPTQKLSEIMETVNTTVTPEVDQEEVLRLAYRYDLDVVPVVNAGGEMVGVITVDDILEVAQQEASEDMFQIAGTIERDPLHATVFASTTSRLPWLLLSLLDGICIAFLVSKFAATLEAVRQVTFFIPLIPLMGGNVAVQASTIVVRGLATGEIRRAITGSFMARQMAVTILLALSCSLAAGALAMTMFPGVGLVVGGAVGLAVWVAGTLGVLLPFVFNAIGVDPAVSAGPFVTLVNDLFCILIYLALSTLLVAGGG